MPHNTAIRGTPKLLHGPTLSVRFPEAKCNTLSTATELVEHHPGCAPMHSIMPIEPTNRIERAIQVVDANVINTNLVPVFIPISGRGLTRALLIDQDPSPGGVSKAIRCVLAFWLTHGWKHSGLPGMFRRQ